ncbi:MAG: adenylate kinase family protein [Patescibacteria group bacterium]
MKLVSFIGRPGCGKGTQAERIIKKTNWEPIYTGKLLRKRAKKDDFMGNKIEEALSEGRLIPTPMVFNIWMPKLIEFKKSGDTDGVLFDGNPRKLYEAKMLEEVFEMFEWPDFTPIHIQISPKESRERLLKRGRADDNEKEIKRRLGWFESDVRPVLDYYAEKGILEVVDGEQTIEEVQKDIIKILGLDD